MSSFRPRTCPSVETTAKRGGLLSSGRGRRWLPLLLSSLLSASAPQNGCSPLACRTALARRGVWPHILLSLEGIDILGSPRLSPTHSRGQGAHSVETVRGPA